MTDTNTALDQSQNPGTQDPGTQNPPEPPAQQQQDPDDQGQTDDGRSIEKLPKWAQKEIKDLRGESAKYRTRAKELEEATKSEQEKALDEARAEGRSEATPVVKRALARAALAEAGVKKPAKAVKLLDLDSIELNEDGEAPGLTEAVEELKEEFPEFFSQKTGTNPSLGNRGDQPKPMDMNDLIRRGFGRG